MAAMAAAKGVTGALEILEGEVGFGAAMSVNPDWTKATRGLGTDYHINHVTFKNHGCCGHTFPAIDAVLDAESAARAHAQGREEHPARVVQGRSRHHRQRDARRRLSGEVQHPIHGGACDGSRQRAAERVPRRSHERPGRARAHEENRSRRRPRALEGLSATSARPRSRSRRTTAASSPTSSRRAKATPRCRSPTKRSTTSFSSSRRR